MAPKRKLNRGLEALLGTGLLNKPDADTETPRVTEGRPASANRIFLGMTVR